MMFVMMAVAHLPNCGITTKWQYQHGQQSDDEANLSAHRKKAISIFVVKQGFVSL